MSFVGELLDANIKKEMSDEVMDFKAKYHFQFEFECGYTQQDRTTWNSIRMDIHVHVLRHIICV